MGVCQAIARVTTFAAVQSSLGRQEIAGQPRAVRNRMFDRTGLLFACAAFSAAAIACSADPDTLRERYTQSGDRYFAAKQYAEASIEYRNAIQQNPRWGPVRFKLGDTYRLMEDHEAAYREYMRAADLMPRNIEAQVRAAQYLLAAGRHDDARIRATNVLKVDPQNVDALIVQGATLAQMKNVDSAVAQVLQAIEIDPLRPASYTSLGALEAARGHGLPRGR